MRVCAGGSRSGTTACSFERIGGNGLLACASSLGHASKALTSCLADIQGVPLLAGGWVGALGGGVGRQGGCTARARGQQAEAVAASKPPLCRTHARCSVGRSCARAQLAAWARQACAAASRSRRSECVGFQNQGANRCQSVPNEEQGLAGNGPAGQPCSPGSTAIAVVLSTICTLEATSVAASALQ